MPCERGTHASAAAHYDPVFRRVRARVSCVQPYAQACAPPQPGLPAKSVTDRKEHGSSALWPTETQDLWCGRYLPSGGNFQIDPRKDDARSYRRRARLIWRVRDRRHARSPRRRTLECRVSAVTREAVGPEPSGICLMPPTLSASSRGHIQSIRSASSWWGTRLVATSPLNSRAQRSARKDLRRGRRRSSVHLNNVSS
jgi:hypothetical protein